jgi:hypothetical protein
MGLAPVLGTENDVIAIHDGRLIKFDLGARRIAFELKAAFSGQPSVAKSVIYAIRDGGVEARRESDGGLIWRWVPPSGAATGALIVTDTHVLAATNAATHALDVQTGQSAWTHPIGGHMALADDTLYIASGSNVTAIAMPGFSAAPPTAIAIVGPATTGESGTTRYAAYVTYADGRVRERTRNASWTLSATASATIDAEGGLIVGELLSPSERIIIHAQYEENGVEVHADLDVELRIGVTLDEFVARNVTAAIDAQGRARDALQEALAHESAAISVASEQARRSRSAGGVWRTLLTQLRKARILTLQSDQRARQSIDTLEGGTGDGKR